MNNQLSYLIIDYCTKYGCLCLKWSGIIDYQVKWSIISEENEYLWLMNMFMYMFMIDEYDGMHDALWNANLSINMHGNCSPMIWWLCWYLLMFIGWYICDCENWLYIMWKESQGEVLCLKQLLWMFDKLVFEREYPDILPIMQLTEMN